MDDVFQILIYVLIAVSFLSSFFKKKKPVKQPADELQQKDSNLKVESVVESPPFSKAKTRDIDILKEFENFFNLNEPAAPPKKITVPKHDDKQLYDGARNRDNYIKVPEESFHQPTSSEHSFINPWEQKRKEVEKQKKSITEEIEKKASKYKENLEKTDTAATGISHNIRNRIKDPASLKEYIVISEIIGKPKARRGWSQKNIS